MNRQAWRYYVGFYRGMGLRLTLSVLLAAGQAVFLLPLAFLVRLAFDTLIPNHEFGELIAVGAGILLITLLNNGANVLARYLTLDATKQAVVRLRGEVLDKCYILSRHYHSRADRSVLHSEIVHDTERVDGMSDSLLTQILPALCTAIALFLLLLYLNPILFLVLATMMPILVVAGRKMGRLVRANTQEFHRAFTAFSRGALLLLQRMDLTRVQAAETLEKQELRARIEHLGRTSKRKAWLDTADGALHGTIVTLWGVVILIVGGWAVAHNQMTVGDLLSYYVAVSLLSVQLRGALAAIPHVIEGNASLNTLYEFLNVQDAEPYHGTRSLALGGHVKLDEVWFDYDGAQVLRGVTLTLRPSVTTAVVGANGAGKSTITYLMLGLYRPPRGVLMAEGVAYDQLAMSGLRAQIGVVMQDAVLFPGTVRENITYGSPNATDGQVIRASQIATAHEFITCLTDGYETFVGEGGMLLSGGQRQRIALARAVLRQPALLILDEPTNHLDLSSIGHFMQNLHTLEPRPAILIISHDLQVAHEADEVFELSEGCLTPLLRMDAYARSTLGTEKLRG